MKRGPALLVIGLSLGTTLVATAPPRPVAAVVRAGTMGQCNYTGYSDDYSYCYYDNPWAEWPYVSCSWSTDYTDCHNLVWLSCGGGPGNWVATYAWCEDGPGPCPYSEEFGFALQYIECWARYQEP